MATQENAERPAEQQAQAPAQEVKPIRHSRLRGIFRFLKGVAYAIPVVNIVPMIYDASRSISKYFDSRKAENTIMDSAIDATYSGGASSTLGFLSYITKPIKWFGYRLGLNLIPAIYNGYKGLKDAISPEGIDNPGRGERNYPRDLGYPTNR